MVIVTHESYDSVLVGLGKQKGLESSENRKWWHRCDAERQIVPDGGTSNWKRPLSDCRETDGRNVQTMRGRKERKWTCVAPIVSITRPLSTQMWITQSYLQVHHICLSFVYAFARGRSAANSFTHLSTDILLIPRPTDRVTTLQTLKNSLTFPWQYAALMSTLSGTRTRSMPVLLVLMSMIRIWTSTWLHYATNDKIN